MPGNPLSHIETAELCRSFSELLHAGLSAADGCQILSGELSGDRKNQLLKLGELLDQGIPLGDGLLLWECFPSSTARLIQTGELSGNLEEVLSSAAQYHENRAQTSRHLRSALGYPALLLVVMVAVISILLIQVLPVFDSVYASLGSSMTGFSASLLMLGQALKKSLPVLLLLLIIAAVCLLIPPIKGNIFSIGKRLMDDRWLIRDFHNARFLQALSLGVRSGLVPEDAIHQAAAVMQDSPRAYNRCRNCSDRVRSGSALWDVLSEAAIIGTYGARMLSLGAKSGSTDRIIQELAEKAQELAENNLHDALSKVEPAMVLSCSILTGIIVLSVMLPLIQILSALG